MKRFLAFTVIPIVVVLATPAMGLAQATFEREPIGYLDAEAHDRVAKLQKQLASGDKRLAYDEHFGYLPALLDELKVPTSSQMLVFSKTSFQQKRISPTRPRAIYFNDDVYVGWVQHGDVVELSAADPQLGAVFYALAQEETDPPKLQRQTHNCLQCHASSLTDGSPGHLVRSVYPDTDGFPLLGAGTFRTTQESPLSQRWGGWYVTGTHGELSHLGNMLFEEEPQSEDIENPDGVNLTDLGERFDTSKYLTPHSDIVALMVLEHQAKMHNLITQANHAARRALFDEQVMNRMLERPADYRSESTTRRIQRACDELLNYMLFVGEAKVEAPIAGTSTFAQDFAARGPRDQKGRSLRELDLKQRLFKYPCSYLVYSEAFDGLPDPSKSYIYRRLWEVLGGEDTTESFAHLNQADRAAILQILLETKEGLPDYWKRS